MNSHVSRTVIIFPLAFVMMALIAALVLTACVPLASTTAQPTPAIQPTVTEGATSTPEPAADLPTSERAVSSATPLPVLPLPVREEVTFTVAGQLGGTFNAVDLDGNIVYLGVGPRLVTVDIGDPSAPRYLWQSDVLPGVVYDVAVQAGLAYVAAGHDLHIYDISDPANPVRISSLSGFAGPEQIFFAEIDIIPFGDAVYTINFVSGNGNFQSLKAIEVSDPTQPTVVGTRDLSGIAGITVSGDVLYIANEGKLQLLDAANLDEIFSEIELSSAWSYSVTVLGDVAYVVENQLFEGPDSLLVLDVSDPGQPKEIITKKMDIEHTIRGVAATNETLFLMGQSWGGHSACPTSLYVFDITDPASPQDPAKFDPQSCLNRFALVGDTLVATSDRGLQIFDVSDPANIALAGEFAPPAGFSHVGAIALNQDVAYIISEDPTYPKTALLRVLDLTEPAAPRWTGEALDLSSQYDEGAAGLYVRGNRLFLPIQGALRAIDISRPLSPRLLTREEGGAGSYSVPVPAVVGNVLYAQVDGGLGIVDMSDPANPVPVKTISTEGSWVTGLSATDRFLVVFSSKDGSPQDPGIQLQGSRLQIFDVSDPLTPVEVGRLEPAVDLPEQVWDVTVAGDTVYAASVGAGEENEYNEYTLYALDISDPSHPVEIGRFELPGNATRMVAAGDTIYMRLSEGGIWALNVRDRSHPYLSGHFPLPISDFGIDGDLLYLAAGDAGLYIVQVEE